MADDAKQSAVYVAWPTFKNALDLLAQGDLPNVIDRSAFPNLAGGVQSQLMAAFKFLGLIDEGGRPTPKLHAVAVADEAARKEELKQILQARYKDLFALGLEKTTPQQLHNTMGSSYSVSGDTRDKAVRFFLSAVQYTGVPLSRFLSKPASGGSTTPRKRPARIKPSSSDTPSGTPGSNPSNGTITSRTVELDSGGTLTLTASVDMFNISPEDRKFVFELIDKIAAYTSDQPTSEDDEKEDSAA